MPTSIPCRICSGGTTPPRAISHGKLYSCRVCGSRFLEPGSATNYDAHYYEAWFADPGQNIQRLKGENFRRLLRHYPRPLAGKKVLDIGCATGFLLEEARRQGAEVTGIDVNIWATEQARKLVPEAPIFTGTLHDALTGHFFAPGTFDLITATDVIEHVVEIKPFLRELLGLLATDGVALFTLPDPESFSARAMGNSWFQYKAEHVTYPTRKALALLATELGFTIERIKPHRKILTLEYLSNVLTHHNRGWVSNLGRATGKIAGFLGLARRPLPFGTGEMLVMLTNKNNREHP